MYKFSVSLFLSHIIKEFSDGRGFTEDRFQFSLGIPKSTCGDRLNSMCQLLLCYMNISKMMPERREGKDTTYRYVRVRLVGCIKIILNMVY